MGLVLSPLKSAKLAKFRVWLAERGAEIQRETNQYEVIRYKAGTETHLIYRNDANTRWTAVNGAQHALTAFLNGTRWLAPIARVRHGASMSVTTYDALVLRDGDECFYCGHPVSLDQATTEHMVARSHGGPNHISNFVLAHKPCNQAAGNLSVAEKVRLRERMLINEGMKAA